jgi:sec-independent protein translocase protein TatC
VTRAADAPPDDRRMTVFEHLEELRKRVTYALVYWVLCSAVVGIHSDGLMGLLLRPFMEALLASGNEPRMIYTEPTASFAVVFKIVLILGAFVAAPFVFWELWGFVAAGLYGKEKRLVLLAAPISYLLFAGGAVFFYFAVLPAAVDFLYNYGRDFFPDQPGWRVEQLPAVPQAVSFFLWMALSMGLVFQLPLVMVFLHRIGVVETGTFFRYQRHFILGATVVAAMLTPTGDAVTLGLFMVPILGLYYVGLLIVWLRGRGAPRAPEGGTP